MKKKFGWTAWGICGCIFAVIGAIFVPIGWFVPQIPNVRISGNGGVEFFRAMFCGMVGLFLVLGLCFLLVDVRRRARLRRAYDMGNYVEAKILGMKELKHIDVNNRHPNVIECAWTGTDGVEHIYRSRALFREAWPLKSDTVPVYIDRDDERIGFVDIDAVLEEIKIHR